MELEGKKNKTKTTDLKNGRGGCGSDGQSFLGKRKGHIVKGHRDLEQK